MAVLVPNNGEGDALKYILNFASPENLVLRLFTSNTTPAETDTAATYTEATGFGYAAISLTASSWVITEGAPSTAAFPLQTFTFTGGLGAVYGYYLTRASSGRLFFAERFTDGPYQIVNNGDQVKVTLNLTLD